LCLPGPVFEIGVGDLGYEIIYAGVDSEMEDLPNVLG